MVYFEILEIIVNLVKILISNFFINLKIYIYIIFFKRYKDYRRIFYSGYSGVIMYVNKKNCWNRWFKYILEEIVSS